MIGVEYSLFEALDPRGKLLEAFVRAQKTT